MQYIYYGTLLRRRQRLIRNQQRLRRFANRGLEEDPAEAELAGRYPFISQLGQNPKPRIFACVALIFVFGGGITQDRRWEQFEGGWDPRRRLLVEPTLLMSHHTEWRRYVGQSVGWISSFFYLGSRLSQIYKNWSRQSADGLSLAMFGCAIAANIFYGCGILLRTYAWHDLVGSAPWLLGSLGTVFLDFVIFSQFSRYRNKRLPEQAPLIEEEASSD